MVRFLATAALLFGVELLWSGSLSPDEIATAAGLAIALAAWTVVLRRVSHRHFRFPRAAWRPLAKAVAELPGATMRTVVALARPIVPARADAIPFRHGREHDPRDRARRAAALLGASITPETFVVRGDQGRDTVALHVVGRRPARGDAEWLA